MLEDLEADKSLGLEDVKTLLEKAKEAFYRRQMRRKRRHYLQRLQELKQEEYRNKAESLAEVSASRLDAYLAHPLIRKVSGRADASRMSLPKRSGAYSDMRGSSQGRAGERTRRTRLPVPAVEAS